METIDEIEYKGFTIQTYYDTDAQDGPDTWGNFEIVQFRDSDKINHGNLSDYLTELAYLKPEIRQKLKAGKMFTIDYRSYSSADGGKYYLDGGIPVPREPLDSQDINGFIIFQDEYIKGMTYEQRREYARGDLDTYTQWANGEVYGFIILDSENNEIDSCWDIYGYDDMVEDCKAEIDRQLSLPLSQQPRYKAPFASALHR